VKSAGRILLCEVHTESWVKLVDGKLPLTWRQREVLDWVKGFIQEHDGVAPTFDEIGRGVGLRSLSAVHEHIHNLVAKGHLRMDPQVGRSLEVLP
jgi:SOS-response transcriptional repressor LexA